MDRLLELIEEGDPDLILSEEKLIPRFNELMKYDLVTLKDEKVFLTEKGKEAKRKGVDKIIKQEKLAQIQNTITLDQLEKKPAITFPPKIRNRKFWIVSLLILLLLALSFTV